VSDTPRTDAEIAEATDWRRTKLNHYVHMTGVLNQWARSLELELTARTQEVEGLRSRVRELETESSSLRAEIQYYEDEASERSDPEVQGGET
jgi:hypothetical protein